MATSALAVMSPEGGLSRYLSEIRKFPMLAKDEEFMLAKRWQEHEDPKPPIASSPRTCAWWPRSPWATAAMACRSGK
jgi:hypothetical protein